MLLGTFKIMEYYLGRVKTNMVEFNVLVKAKNYEEAKTKLKTEYKFELGYKTTLSKAL